VTISRDELHRRIMELQLAVNAIGREIRDLNQAVRYHIEAQPEEEMDTRPTQVTDSPWMPAPEQGPPY
jgi:hypothetical protein